MTRALTTLALLLIPGLAFGQATYDSGESYMKGLTHTLFGLDHVIAMISVGLISSQLGNRAVWQVPLIFVLTLVVGGATGMILPESDARDWILSTSEIVIMMSDLLLVLAIIWIPFSMSRENYATGITIVGLFIIVFGLFHGFAHGGEIPDGASALFYVLGFATTSTIMHIVGVGIGEAARAFPQPRVARGVFAAVLLGISIPYQVDFWNSVMPFWALELFGF